jgi:hypothetical protein
MALARRAAAVEAQVPTPDVFPATQRRTERRRKKRLG